jgi:hypothetical protein
VCGRNSYTDPEHNPGKPVLLTETESLQGQSPIKISGRCSAGPDLVIFQQIGKNFYVPTPIRWRAQQA